MFSLKRFLARECILKLIIFVRVVKNQSQGYVSLKSIPWKILNEMGFGMLYFIFIDYNALNRYSCRGVIRTLSNIYDWDFLRK